MLICLDPGHGGRDSGAVNGSRYEKNDTLRLANILRTALFKRGLNVVMTRTNDSYVSLKERSDFANNSKADYFVSLHRNSFTDNTAKGVENWVYQASDSKTSGFAAAIMEKILKVESFTNRGVKRGNFHVTRETDMPACLLELGFISNAQDNAYFDDNLSKYADAIALAIADYAGVKDNGSTVDPDKLYRVQVGAYAKRENADRIAKELAEKGYDTVIV